MQVPLLIFAFVTVLVNMVFGQSCDTNKITGCLTTLTNTIRNDISIGQDQSKFCNVFQRYVDCVLTQACIGVSLSDSAKDQIRQELRQYNINCNLNQDSDLNLDNNLNLNSDLNLNSGAAEGMSSALFMVISFFAVVGVFFAL